MALVVVEDGKVETDNEADAVIYLDSLDKYEERRDHAAVLELLTAVLAEMPSDLRYQTVQALTTSLVEIVARQATDANEGVEHATTAPPSRRDNGDDAAEGDEPRRSRGARDGDDDEEPRRSRGESSRPRRSRSDSRGDD